MYPRGEHLKCDPLVQASNLLANIGLGGDGLPGTHAWGYLVSPLQKKNWSFYIL